MNKQKGFTLIELIVVIIIIGILAVTALPRMMNLQKDARRASLQGLKGALQGSMLIVYGKAAASNLDTVATGTVTAEGVSISTVYGSPAATDVGIVRSLQNAADFSTTLGTTDWIYRSTAATGTTPGTMTFTFNNTALAGTGADEATLQNQHCYVLYTEATSGASAQATAMVSGIPCNPAL